MTTFWQELYDRRWQLIMCMNHDNSIGTAITQLYVRSSVTTPTGNQNINHNFYINGLTCESAFTCRCTGYMWCWWDSLVGILNCLPVNDTELTNHTMYPMRSENKYTIWRHMQYITESAIFDRNRNYNWRNVLNDNWDSYDVYYRFLSRLSINKWLY